MISTADMLLLRRQVLTGRDFREIRDNITTSRGGKIQRPPGGVYVGFSLFQWEDTLTVYCARLDATCLGLDGNKISGRFEHSIHKVHHLNGVPPKRGDPTKVAYERFGGVWFPEDGRMMVSGIRWDDDSANKELGIGLENYDLFFQGDIIVGNWASREDTDFKQLSNAAKFNQAVYMKRIPESVAYMSQEKIIEFLSIGSRYSLDEVASLHQSVGTETKCPLKIRLMVESITGVEQVTQTFGASFKVILMWPPSLQDIYYHISGGTTEDWKPEWTPPTPFFSNKTESREDLVEGTPELVKIEGEKAYSICQTFTYNSIFLESLELHHFPFDVQEFKIKVKMTLDGNETDISFERVEVSDQVEDLFQSSEWDPQIKNTTIEEKKFHDDGTYCFSLVLRKKRNWTIYFWRVIFVMALISLGSLFVIGLDPVNDAGDRLGFLVTMFLAALAYSIVIADYLPKLSYLTLLDKYVILTYVYICALMAAEVLLLFFAGDDEDVIRDADRMVNPIFLAIWVLWQLCYIFALLFYRHKEKKKLELKIENFTRL